LVNFGVGTKRVKEKGEVGFKGRKLTQLKRKFKEIPLKRGN